MIFFHGCGVKMTSEEIEKVIEKSQKLLQLKVGWDGEDDSQPITKFSLDNAISFLKKLHAKYPSLEEVSIGPYYDGGVDLHIPKINMLINFAPTSELSDNHFEISLSSDKIGFYGDDISNVDADYVGKFLDCVVLFLKV